MTKMLVFDMDGTIADFYGVNGWLDAIRAEDVRPYAEAAPMYNMDELCELLKALQRMGWVVAVTTWLAKDATTAYDNAVRVAKKNWLDKHEFPYDELHMVKYGTTKANCTRKRGGFQVLFDDNAQVRKGWHLGEAVDANNNIMEYLKGLTA